MTDRASILIIDDELGPRESLRMILKPSYEVYTAEDGMAALRFLETRSVDLITLDLKMPGLSGMEVLEQIRKSNPDLMVIIVTGYGTFRSAVEAIRFDVFDYISKPFSVPEIMSVVKRCLELRSTRRAIANVFRHIAGLAETGSSESHQAHIVKAITELSCNSGSFDAPTEDSDYLGFIRLTSSCIEKMDPYTAGHSERVRQHAEFLAQRMELSQPVREDLQIASYLHDVGKVCISSRFMNGEGKLSSTEWAILKRHPIKSVELVAPLNLSRRVISAIRHHHERFDGTGYPDGLAGSDIPLEAQILSIGNVYDALTSKKPYRNAMSPVEAKAEIQRCAGSYFDPDLTRVFLEVLSEHKEFLRQGDGQEEPNKEAS